MKPRGDGGAADGKKCRRSWGAAPALPFPPAACEAGPVLDPAGAHGRTPRLRTLTHVTTDAPALLPALEARAS
ncbi:hypothetical protein STENM327S_08067 [Streptomyces tendae]